MAHLVETMAYTGQTPWHELGHALPAKQGIDVCCSMPASLNHISQPG